MRDVVAVSVGKAVSLTSTLLKIGAGATWPGEIALTLSPSILRPLARQFKQGVILVVGTNGKTTTSLMIKTILTYEGAKVVYNSSGANLLNGLVSSCLKSASLSGKITADWGIFEVDENSLPIILQYVKPKAVVILNLFRDQLDRYGEVDVIAEKWHKAIEKLDGTTHFILNADDPLVASFGNKQKGNVSYFGLTEASKESNVLEHATDSIFCLTCGSRLSYAANYFSHLGDWFCPVCGEKRPKLTLSTAQSPLPGLYNKYNTLAAVLVAQRLGIHNSHVKAALSGFAPAFGRQEECDVNGKKVKLFLSKNPAGFNASLRAVLEMKPKAILVALNDRIPDGRDVSWIWDVDFEMIPDGLPIVVTGDRVYDLALRITYAKDAAKKAKNNQKFIVDPDIERAIEEGLSLIQKGDTLFVLPTYSAMLDIRKIITGRKIL